MSIKHLFLFALVLPVLPAGAEDLPKNKFKQPVEVLSDPGKLVPDSTQLAKDCSPEEKLQIDCRDIMEKVRAEFQHFKDESDKLIRIHNYEIGDMLKKIKVESPELKSAVENYKTLNKPSKKDIAKIFQLSGIPKNTEYNCFVGPDFFYLYDPKYGQCNSGFTRKDAYEVTTKKIELNEEGELELVVCRNINFVPSSFKMCGSRNLENGAQWVDTVGASQAVTKIKEVKVPDDIQKVFHFKRGETYNLFDMNGMVEKEVRAKHKKCVPFLPKTLN